MATTSDSIRTLSNPTRATLGEQTSKVAEEVRELGNIALSSAGEALQSVKERGGEVLEKGKERAGAAREGFEGYVSENPFKSVLIAAGIGALIGYGIRSRK